MSVAGMGLWCVPWGGGSLRSSVGVGGLAGLMGWGLLFVIGSSSLCDTSPSPSLIITTSSSGPPLSSLDPYPFCPPPDIRIRLPLFFSTSLASLFISNHDFHGSA